MWWCARPTICAASSTSFPNLPACQSRRRRLKDLSHLLREAVLLQEAGQPDVAFETEYLRTNRSMGRDGCHNDQSGIDQLD